MKEEKEILELLENAGINPERQLCIAIDAYDEHVNLSQHAKQIALLCDKLFCMGIAVILTGTERNRRINREICYHAKYFCHDFTSRILPRDMPYTLTRQEMKLITHPHDVEIKINSQIQYESSFSQLERYSA